MTSAARVGDPIEHSEALNGLLLGLAVGAAAVVVAAAVGVSIVASGGLAAVAVVGAVVSLSAGVGELIGSLSYCTNTAGHISKGSSNVFINGRPAARAHLDTAECDKHGQVPQVIAEGSSTVYINGQPAARVGDRTICDGKISAGSDNVYIGGETEQTDDINPEVPGWLHGVVLGIGFGSAVVLTSWATAIVGFIGGAVGGYGGGVIGGRRYGEGSDEQKVMAFGGAFIGGSLAGKGQQWFDSRYEFKTQGLGSLFGNIKVSKKPASPIENRVGISSELYKELRAKTPSTTIRKMVNKNVALPMDDPALPGMTITKPLHADHIVPMKQITEMDGFARLTFEDQVSVLNYKPNFIDLSEVANTSKGTKSFADWSIYKKIGIDVDPQFKASMIKRTAELEPELQQHIYTLLEKK
ncbi:MULTISPECIES: PAAR domain-containing protein [Pseudomonas syringae group]|uniref:Rhs protein n=1 Tax=Pseudomonas amygdali pv. morsprunorum TaxID=129138 RepID=A0A3M2WJ29_PSEA0|nr:MULTISPECIES: PAAR domain-containing protein [Pseudomonas syringae group]EGH08050.1 Rhs family protein [Pseudomonas amygdali pv. morsprunorum str. M302280]RML50688.1 Rhs protein [Pseudomonas amygdali pv. morsprunorum]